MKKKLVLITPILGICSLVFSLAVKPNYKEASAAYESKLVFSDHFDSGEINDNWFTTPGVSLKRKYPSLRFSPKTYDWDACLVYDERISGDFKVRIEMATHDNGDWFAVSFGSPTNSAPFSSSRGGFAFHNGITEFLHSYGDELKPDDSYLNESLSVFSNELGRKRTAEISIHQVDATHSTIQCEIFDQGTSIGTILPSPVTVDNLNGYISFNDSLKSTEIYHFEIIQNETTIVDDDFSSSTIFYPTGGPQDSKWISKKFSDEDVKVGYISSLSLGDIDNGACYSNPLDEVSNVDVSIAYTIESEIQYSVMDLDIESGIEIGKEELTSKGYFFGVRRKSSGGYSLVSYRPNQNQETVIDHATDAKDMTIKAVLTIYQDKTINFKLGELELNSSVDSYSGYCGLFNRNNLDNKLSGQSAYFNYFEIYKDNYYKRDNIDMYQNFNGVKEDYYEDLDVYTYEYFISRSEWNIGSNIKLNSYQYFPDNGKLLFSGSTNTSAFGPKKMYKDFVVKFDVEITTSSIPNGGILGLEFGNSRAGIYYENAKSLGVGFYNNQTIPVIKNVDYAEGASNEFDSEDGNFLVNPGKFTLMYICRNNVVSLYVLIQGKEESTLSKLRTSVVCRENENTDGYVAIFGVNNISFSVDNVSFINLDIEAPATTYSGTTDYQEVTRYDFSKSGEINGLSTNNATYQNSKYRLNENGEIKTTKLVNDYVLRLKIKDIENTLLINQDNLNVKFVNKRDKYIEIDDGASVIKKELPQNYQFINSYLEVEKIGTTLNVRFVSGDTPFSRFEDSVISFSIAGTNNSLLTIKSLNGFADIYSYTFVNLNKYVTMSSRNYDPDIDDITPWYPKPPKDEGSNKNGCSGSASCSSIIIAGSALLILCAVILVRRRMTKYEK